MYKAVVKYEPQYIYIITTNAVLPDALSYSTTYLEDVSR